VAKKNHDLTARHLIPKDADRAGKRLPILPLLLLPLSEQHRDAYDANSA
jgi:hypothetical protein